MRSLQAILLVTVALASAGPTRAGLEVRDLTPAGGPHEVGGDDAPLIRLTATVIDAKGRPLTGLKAADFELVVDGVARPIETAELVRPAPEDPRTFAFLLDEFHVAPSDNAAVREALLQFVDRSFRPADVALVFKPLDSLDTIATTADREALRHAIATFDGRKADYAPRTDFERSYMAQAPAAVAAARAQIVTSALRAIGTSLSQHRTSTPVIVLVSDGFGRMRTSRDVPANLQAAIRLANRAGAPIYALAPALERPPADDPSRSDPAYAALATVTAQTGGRLAIGPDGMTTGLSGMMRDLEARYVVSYRPAHGLDGRFHEVRLAASRQGIEVRTQAGYIAPPAAAARAAAPTASAPLRVLRRSALIQSWSGFFPSATDRGTVMLTWEPAPLRGGARARASTIVLTASTPDGAVLFDAPVAPAGTVGPAGIPNAATFEAPLGPVRVDIKILDDSGIVIDTDARDVAVPAARADRPTIYPPAVLRTRSAREFRNALEDAQTAPVATREFRRTDRLLIRVPAVDATGSPAPVTAVLLNRWRQPMRDVTALEGAGPPGVTQFDLLLAPLAPGEYSLRLTAASPGGSVSEVLSFRVHG